MSTRDRARAQNSFSGPMFLQCEFLDRAEIKKISKNLLKAYKEGYLEEEVFEEVIEHLLGCYLEKSLEDKLNSKFVKLDNKLVKFSWHEIR